jgi:hypothetical protein
MVRTIWPCRCDWEAQPCPRWAQSNKNGLCARHFTYDENRRLNNVAILANIRHNSNAAPAENNVHNQVNNNENRHVADETQPVMAPPEILGAPYHDGGGRALPSLHWPFNRGRGQSR